MSIQKVKITNFKSFQGSHTIELNSGLNIIVGNNDEGKSTIIEAIHMALTGYYHGRSIANEITEYIFNKRVVEDYCKSLKSPSPLPPPNLSIEIFFDDLFDANYQGQHNSENNKLGRGLKLDIWNLFTGALSERLDNKKLVFELNEGSLNLRIF